MVGGYALKNPNTGMLAAKWNDMLRYTGGQRNRFNVFQKLKWVYLSNQIVVLKRTSKFGLSRKKI